MKQSIKLLLLTICLAIAGLLVFLYYNPPCFMMGCTGGYTFNDSAIFFAPKSKIKIIIQSSGYVPFGEDLGSGRSKVKLMKTDNTNDTVFLKASSNSIDTVIYKGTKNTVNIDRFHSELLSKYLNTVGYRNVNECEIFELTEAITLINFGHKGGFTAGQTKYIEVLQMKKASVLD